MLTRIFHREDSAKDLEASQRSSCTSVRSRFGPLSTGTGTGTGTIPAAASLSAPICGDYQDAMFKLSDVSVTAVPKPASRSATSSPAPAVAPAIEGIPPASVPVSAPTTAPMSMSTGAGAGGAVAGAAVAAAAAATAIATFRLKGKDQVTESMLELHEEFPSQIDDFGVNAFAPSSSVLERKRETGVLLKCEPRDSEASCFSDPQMPRITISTSTAVRQQFTPSSPTAGSGVGVGVGGTSTFTSKPESATVPPSDPGLLFTLIESGATLAKPQELIMILPPSGTEEKESPPSPPACSPAECENEPVCALPYVPSAAIPIPLATATATTAAVALTHPSVPLDLLDVNLPPPPQRRTRNADFPQLEPILEHSEVTGDSPELNEAAPAPGATTAL